MFVIFRNLRILLRMSILIYLKWLNLRQCHSNPNRHFVPFNFWGKMEQNCSELRLYSLHVANLKFLFIRHWVGLIAFRCNSLGGATCSMSPATHFPIQLRVYAMADCWAWPHILEAPTTIFVLRSPTTLVKKAPSSTTRNPALLLTITSKHKPSASKFSCQIFFYNGVYKN